MKTLILRLFAMIGFGLLVVTVGTGQTFQAYRANIPFDFVINGGEMKAGKYEVAPISSTQCRRTIMIRDLDTLNAKILGSADCGNAVEDFDQPATLTFWKNSENADKFILVKVDTPTIQMKMKSVWTDVQILSRTGKAPELVTVALY